MEIQIYSYKKWKDFIFSPFPCILFANDNTDEGLGTVITFGWLCLFLTIKLR